MTIKKCGLILIIMTCFLVGISCGDFINDPIEAPSWYHSDYGIFNPGWFDTYFEPTPNLYEPFNFDIGWFDSHYEPTINLTEPLSEWFGYDMSDVLYPIEEDADTIASEQEQIIAPEPLSISQWGDLFDSTPVISPAKPVISTGQKQAQATSLSSEGGIFF